MILASHGLQEGLAMVTVFLVDDHEVVRRGLADLLASDPDLEIVGDAGSVSEAKVRISALKPDVAVLDVRLPDGNGIELCRDLLSELPELRCLMLTSFTSDEAMLQAILAGASGYVVKDIRGMELARAIKTVGAGKSLLDNRAAAALMAKLPRRRRAQRSTIRIDRARANATRTSQRGIDQQANRRPDVSSRENDKELRIAAAGQTRHGTADPSSSVRLEVGPTVRPADYGYRSSAGLASPADIAV